MCLLCGATGVPVCAVSGPCTTTIQHVASFALLVGSAGVATARMWFGNTITRIKSFWSETYRA